MVWVRGVGRRRISIVAGGVVAATAALSVLVVVPASAATAAALAAQNSPSVAGTPCTAAASACVDLATQKAWLIKDGKVVRGPVSIATGGPGEDTPPGDVFRVYRKDKNHKTAEFKLPNGQPAPMPYSVFFENGGIAFHGGDPDKASAGCVHLNLADAIAFFNSLQIGDHVQVKPGTPHGADDHAADDHGDSQGHGGHHHSDDDD